MKTFNTSWATIFTHWGRDNGRHFADDILKCIPLNENFLIFNKISLKYVPYGLIDNMATLVKIMACHLSPNRRQSIIWTNVGMFYWGIYAPLGLNEFKRLTHSNIFWILFIGRWMRSKRWNFVHYVLKCVNFTLLFAMYLASTDYPSQRCSSIKHHGMVFDWNTVDIKMFSWTLNIFISSFLTK